MERHAIRFRPDNLNEGLSFIFRESRRQAKQEQTISATGAKWLAAVECCSQKCAGSLIAPQYVLTAAQCVTEQGL